MTKEEIIDYLYENHVQGVASIEEMAEDLAESERKTGRWGEHGECPFCGYLRQWDDDNYCGNCGARMEINK